MRGFWIALMLGTLLARGADWPMARGNQQLTGVAPGKLGERFELAWRFETGGAIKGGPAVVGNRVYVGSDDGHVYALTADTGERVWSTGFGAAVEATPLVLGDSVYVGSSDNTFRALAADTGVERWRVSKQDEFMGGANWTTGPDGQLWVIVGCYDMNVYCLDAATGKQAWAYATSYYVNGTPSVTGDLLAATSCDAHLHLIKARDGSGKGDVEVAAYIPGSAAVVGERAYLSDYGNEVVAIDLAKQEVRWRYTFRKLPFFSSPAVSANKVVVGGRDRQVHCLDADSGTALWRFATRGKVDASPVICGDKVVVGSGDGHLYVLRLKDGAVVWKYLAGKEIASSAAVADGWIYVGCNDGALYAFRPARGGTGAP